MRNLRWPFLIICVFALLVFPSLCFAQPGDPGNPDVPITGIELLIGIGSLLGIRKLIAGKKNKHDH